MNSTFLLTASSEAFNSRWLLFCISAVTWWERPAPVPKHWERWCWPWLLLASSLEVLGGRGGQVGLHPPCSKIIPAEGCSRPLEGVKDPNSISGLLLFRFRPLFRGTFAWRWLFGVLNGPVKQHVSISGSCRHSQHWSGELVREEPQCSLLSGIDLKMCCKKDNYPP